MVCSLNSQLPCRRWVVPKFMRACKVVATPLINLPRRLTKKAVLGCPGSDESLPLGRKSSSKFELAVMLTTEELRPRNGTLLLLDQSRLHIPALHALALLASSLYSTRTRTGLASYS